MRRRVDIAICAALCVVTLAVFWPVRNHDFIAFDTPEYVSENPHLRAGLTGQTVVWAFTTSYAANWHPLTWLSHLLDQELFGLDPAAHHLVNVVFHLANAVLLFLVFRSMTGALWRSAFVAATFAVHPLHVESVAWVAERKDVLSGLLWVLTLGAYVHYVRHPSRARYALALLLFAAGLLAKSMLVTLPFVLLLLDHWPLGRTAGGWRRLVWEKLPFFGLALLAGFVTLVVQRSWAAAGRFSAATSIANALVSYARYLEKSFWPFDLAVFYPHPQRLESAAVVASLLLLVGLTALAVWRLRRQPYLAVGWLWFVGTLTPVIGLIQAGSQAMADRYAYLPLVGLSVAVSWGAADLVKGRRAAKISLATAGAAAVAALAVAARIQVGYWANTTTLFTHALRVTTGNYVAHNLLGAELASSGRSEEAREQLAEAVRLEPRYARARYNLGTLLLRQGELEEASIHLAETARLDPRNADARLNLAISFERLGRRDRAIVEYEEVLYIDPLHLTARARLRALRRGRSQLPSGD